jgi:hypothetical protein
MHGKKYIPFCLVLWELQQYEDRDERRWTGLGVAGVRLLHQYWSESGEIGRKSVQEGVPEYCEGVVEENEDGYRVLLRTESTEVRTRTGHQSRRLTWAPFCTPSKKPCGIRRA